jgi:DNA-binding LacI/PurR family transcriptional regulator
VTVRENGAGQKSRWPRVTIRDVAQEANVSDATVSRVLTGTAVVAEETRAAVLAAIDRMGYIRNSAARQLTGQLSDVIGLLIRDTRNPYYGRLNAELQYNSSLLGLHMLTVTRSNPERADSEVVGLQNLLEQRVRGILVATGVLPQERLRPIADVVPIVMIGRSAEVPGVHSVGFDNDAIGTMAADEVLARGHRRIAVTLPPPEVSASEHPRAAAMIRRVTDAGGSPVTIAVPTVGRIEEGLAEIIQLVRDGKITAVMFSSDERLLAFLTAAQATGLRVPEDVSATGVDGVLPGIDLLGLSTVRLPVEKLSERAVEILRSRLDTGAEQEPVRETYPAFFIAGRTLGQRP